MKHIIQNYRLWCLEATGKKWERDRSGSEQVENTYTIHILACTLPEAQTLAKIVLQKNQVLDIEFTSGNSFHIDAIAERHTL